MSRRRLKAKISFFDIDETIFHTHALINVVKDGEFKGTTVSNYLTGKHATEFELIDPEKYIYTVKYWYDDGKPAMDGQGSYEDSEEGDYTVKAWDRQGNTVTDQAEIQKIAADISKILEEAE